MFNILNNRNDDLEEYYYDRMNELHFKYHYYNVPLSNQTNEDEDLLLQLVAADALCIDEDN